MTVTKCDICKKEIKRGEIDFPIATEGSSLGYRSYTVCANCGKPLAAFLKKRNLDHPEERLRRRAA